MTIKVDQTFRCAIDNAQGHARGETFVVEEAETASLGTRYTVRWADGVQDKLWADEIDSMADHVFEAGQEPPIL